MVLADGVEQRCQPIGRANVRLEPHHLVRDGLAVPGEPEPAVDLLDVALLVEPLGESVTRRAGDVQRVLDLAAVQRLAAKRLEHRPVADDVAQQVGLDAVASRLEPFPQVLLVPGVLEQGFEDG